MEPTTTTAKKRSNSRTKAKQPELPLEPELVLPPMIAYMVTFWICWGTAKYKRAKTILFESNATGIQFGKDMMAICKTKAEQMVAKPGYNVKIHYMTIQEWWRLPILILCMFVASFASASNEYPLCISDWNYPSPKVGEFQFNEAHCTDITYAIYGGYSQYVKKTYKYDGITFKYYVDIIGRETITINDIVVFGDKELVKQL